MRQVYLDNNATSRPDPRVVEKVVHHYQEGYGNASSIHAFGQHARAATEEARSQVASLLQCRSSEVVFTAGGTEADNLAVFGVARARRQDGMHVVTSAIEHPAVLRACDCLEQEGFEVTRVGVDHSGIVDMGQLEEAIRDDTILVSIMHANNEVGAIQPVQEIAGLAHATGAVFHTDAVQTIGKIPWDVGAYQVDLLSMAGHKFHGPKGVGALFIAPSVRLEPLSVGGSHERGRRAGTENVPGAVGLGEACQCAVEALEDFSSRVKALRDRLESGILDSVPDTIINGPKVGRMPHVSNISFEGVEGEALLIALDFQGIAVSTGAACSSGSLEPSHVLRAMHLPRRQMQSAIRFSLSRMTDETEVDYVLEVLPRVVERIRGVRSTR